MSYRLSLTLKGDGPAGRLDDTITLVTSSREHPFLEVQAHTKLNERVTRAITSCEARQPGFREAR